LPGSQRAPAGCECRRRPALPVLTTFLTGLGSPGTPLRRIRGRIRVGFAVVPSARPGAFPAECFRAFFAGPADRFLLSQRVDSGVWRLFSPVGRGEHLRRWIRAFPGPIAATSFSLHRIHGRPPRPFRTHHEFRETRHENGVSRRVALPSKQGDASGYPYAGNDGAAKSLGGNRCVRTAGQGRVRIRGSKYVRIYKYDFV
jgi:hypothetical protein